MSENSNSGTTGGIGFLGLLTILFIAFKLAGIIDWSWLWVLSPLWLPLVLGILVIVVMYMILDYKTKEPKEKGEQQ